MENNGWIKVADRLPEVYNKDLNQSEECLCYSDSFYGKYFVCKYDYDHESFLQEKGHDAIYNPITHWQPLPNPPEQ